MNLLLNLLTNHTAKKILLLILHHLLPHHILLLLILCIIYPYTVIIKHNNKWLVGFKPWSRVYNTTRIFTY